VIALLALCVETTASVTAKRLTQLYQGLFVVAIEMLLGSLLLVHQAQLSRCRRNKLLRARYRLASAAVTNKRCAFLAKPR